MAKQKQVTVYSQPGCGPCVAVKQYLAQRDIPFAERNIRADRQALHDLLRAGYQSTPVVVVDGEAVVGFNRARLDQLLAA